MSPASIVAAVVGGVGVLFGGFSALHALLHKRDPRSQLLWVVVCATVPFAGAIAYWVLGVNRLRTRVRKWHAEGLFEIPPASGLSPAEARFADQHPERSEGFRMLVSTSKRVTGKPLTAGNAVAPLFNGEEAYPRMLEAIRQAKEYVYLATYLFDSDQAGRDFVEELGRASERGVDVRVLVDAIGERYARPRITSLLAAHPKMKVAKFLPLALSLRGLHVNLRNHRKLLVVDGAVGFTGGMNIGQRHMAHDPANKNVTQDVHFSVHGPAVFALEEVFFEDWFFATGDKDWAGYRDCEPRGEALCRGIKDGPNDDFERLLWILCGAIGCAKESVRIMTPYFIPGREILGALTSAALRGIRVEVILPAKNNLPVVAWASQSMLGEVIRHGTRVYHQPAPFNHSKFFVVDDFYINLGSANIDPRSLRLNFEFNLEVFDAKLGAQMAAYFDDVRDRSKEITPNSLASLPMPVRVRNALAKLFAPYL